MSDRWERVAALFDAARALDLDARRSFLELACRNDTALRQEVDALLAAHVPGDSFPSTPAWKPLSSLLSASVVQLKSGQVLKGRYTVEEEISSGGQARVYRATDQVLSRPVVIKVMRVAGDGGPAITSRFDLEMRALARIDHPGVVGILDVGELEEGAPFLVIQYVNGESLRHALQKGPVATDRAAAIIRQLGAALDAAHAVDVAHRDVKPENIMLQSLDNGAEVVKLIDFGLAKVERSVRDRGMTTVMVAGTVRYMAPEQFEGHHSPASDVYAMGLIACEMLTGQPDVRAVPSTFPARTRRLLESALAFRPEDRPTDVNAWSTELADQITSRSRSPVLVMSGAVTLLFVLVMLAPVFNSLFESRFREPVRVIEKVGAFDPLREGFTIHNQLIGTVAPTPERSGYEGWRVTSSVAGGYYFRKLTRAQKRAALERGWTLSTELRLDEGVAFVAIDFVGYGKRFDIEVYREGDMDRVLLLTQIVPAFQGLELQLARAPGAYHKYELRFDPGLQTAALWVDGVKRLDQYRGLSQFQDDMGLFFGAGPYRSEVGTASLKSVRFEIHP
jgi:tRNA A-37 threonylcarbamoyl transferase component Bud32